MANLINTLYPPIIQTFMPAFVNTTDAHIYFSLSPYNSSSEIKAVHVSLVNQLNNENALKNPLGIFITELKYNSEKEMYEVVIPVKSIVGEQRFNVNQFYKVQLRFDNNEEVLELLNTNIDVKVLNKYLLENQHHFSEWSSVCLIRPISKPSIELRGFDTSSGKTLAFNKGVIPISGKVFFENGDFETETNQSYKIQILDEKIDKVLLETETIYTGNQLDPNDINYRLDLQGLNTNVANKFRLRLIAITKNNYTLEKEWVFQIADFLDQEDFHPSIEVTVDNEDGIANLTIVNPETVFGILYVKRASSLDNFTTWESICTKKIAGPIDLTIKDNTIGSLVWYRYSVQLENSKGVLTQVYKSNKILPDFYDVIISRGETQLKVKYNYKVSNYKSVVNRAKIDTLGGRFPKFAENAVLNYKQFSISGSLSAMNDDNEKFLNRKKYFDDEYENYLIYNDTDGKNEFGYKMDYQGFYVNKATYEKNDYFWEREFREAALKWLNDGEPKLYRSMTEGLIPVMITDVSLTPNTQTGRRMWDFSATIYEIADGASLEILDTLGIYNVEKIENNILSGGTVDPEPEFVKVLKVGQLYQYTVSDNNDVISKIIATAMLEKYGGVLSDKKPDDFYLKNVKIFFHNKPHVFYPITQGNTVSIQETVNPGDTITNGITTKDKMFLGYQVQVQTGVSQDFSTIYVNEKGYYQFPTNVDITKLCFLTNDVITLEYVIAYKEKNNQNSIISGSSIEKTVVGQYSGVFRPNNYLGEKIRNKYNFVSLDTSGHTVYYEKMTHWKGISVDVFPYSVLHLKYKGDKEYKDYLVGHTGVLNLLKDYPIEDLCFLGRQFIIVDKKRQDFLEEWECCYSEENNKEPKRNTVYTINGKKKIYYQDKWYDFIEKENTTGLAIVPVEGLINYFGDIVRIDV